MKTECVFWTKQSDVILTKNFQGTTTRLSSDLSLNAIDFVPVTVTEDCADTDKDTKCDDCGECDRCDLDPNKICDNCGACLDAYNTNEKGFVEVPIDKIDVSGGDPTLEDFYESMGLVDEDDED